MLPSKQAILGVMGYGNFIFNDPMLFYQPKDRHLESWCLLFLNRRLIFGAPSLFLIDAVMEARLMILWILAMPMKSMPK